VSGLNSAIQARAGSRTRLSVAAYIFTILKVNNKRYIAIWRLNVHPGLFSAPSAQRGAKKQSKHLGEACGRPRLPPYTPLHNLEKIGLIHNLSGSPGSIGMYMKNLTGTKRHPAGHFDRLINIPDFRLLPPLTLTRVAALSEIKAY